MLTEITFNENNYIFPNQNFNKKNGLFYILANLFIGSLDRRQPESLICFYVYSALNITHHGAP